MTSRPAPGMPARTFRWYLESFVEGGRQLRRITLEPLPFRVGRLPGLDLPLASESVSKEHAELFVRDGALHVRDLGSKNGTLLNNERVGEAMLREGDILHFAQVEFRVGRLEIDEHDEPGAQPATVSLSGMKLPQQFVEGVRELPELLAERQVTSVFQPIVSLPSGTLVGYEALGRGRHPRLPEAPLDLFGIAAGIGAEAELSQVFRETALDLAIARGRLPALFLNVHAAELERPGLVPAIVEARQRAGPLRLTLDIHEGALADLEGVDRLCAQLRRSRIGIAYDDFGAGQARLLELAEVPPTYLKFDMSFIRGIDSAPVSRQRLLTSLVSVARDLLVQTVAEGVETAEEADACMRIGFTHAQGFFFGRPR
ncbi:MAG TPA: EAL domain-containing protein, partial [Vicinamibacteria bacterium]|nr:EAL domain-containing protein [Vicinamibacteria bacterium]